MTDRPTLPPRLRALLKTIKVNAPALMLAEGLMEKFLYWRVHPEIGLDARVLDEIPGRKLEDMARRLKEAGLKASVHGPFFDLSPGALDRTVLEASRQRYQQALETAALFGPDQIVFHAAYEERRHWSFREDWVNISLETWRPLARRAQELGMRLVLENTYEKTPAEIELLLAGLTPEGVGFCFDAGHSAAFGRVAALEWLEALWPYLAALHLHDNHGDRDEHLAIGQGRFDFAALFSWMVERGLRPRIITLEPHQEEQLWQGLTVLADLWPWELSE